MEKNLSGPIISIILVNYNNSKDTILCLQHLILQDFKNFEIIVIENGSELEQIDKLEKKIENIKISSNFTGNILLYKMGKNLGFSGGNNFGIKRAEGDLIYILNSDTIFPSNMLSLMYLFLKSHPKVDVLTPKILYYSDKSKIWGLGGTFNFNNPMISHINFTGQKDRKFPLLLKVDMVTGCATVIRRKSLKQVGLFDPNYFMYWEDTDFSYRANKIGLKMVVNTDIVIYHNVKEEQKTFSKFIIGYLFRNRMYFIMKNLSPWQLVTQILLTPFYFGMYMYNFKHKKYDGRLLFKLKNFINGFSLGIKSRFFFNS
ncbi:MAG: glycosyltransferase family 2 protein [Promethearchaeota archaeon]